MKKIPLYRFFLGIILLLCCNCGNNRKNGQQTPLKKPGHQVIEKTYLHLTHGIPSGILRVECRDCALNYTVNGKDFSITVKNGNEDRFIYPASNTYIKTQLRSNADQLIRVVVIDPNGNIISNVLDSFKKDSSDKNEYLMKYRKTAATIVINQPVAN